MQSAIIQFPGLNRDHEMSLALQHITGRIPYRIWPTETVIPNVDVIVIPGGFSYGDYLRCGAIAARQPVMRVVHEKAQNGVMVLGICNGFQILLEAGLLEGVLLSNASLKFVCREVKLEVLNTDTAFSCNYRKRQIIRCPVAHHNGNYFAEAETLKRLEKNGQVIFRYAQGYNPNGSVHDIAGIVNAKRNVLGMMPHPENFMEEAHGGTDGRALFTSVLRYARKELFI
ncbi:MAG: phosphoribosylformylglycinamidine synthase [Candidatus Tokpelaia sp. JSC085]|nr:MAG: phosphoribosylformylglycinamidine synthase [Candidatus Tokpelaia sp. JSC085]